MHQAFTPRVLNFKRSGTRVAPLAHPAQVEGLEPRLLLDGGLFGQVDGKTVKLPLVDPDDGTLVTFALTGGGTGEVVETADGWDILIAGSTARSALAITTRKAAGAGDDGEVTVHNILVGDWSDPEDATHLKRIAAPKVNLAGDVRVTGSLGGLTLGDTVGDQSTIAIDGEGVPVALTFDEIQDLIIDSDSPIASLNAADWYDSQWEDPQPGEKDALYAPWVGTLTITGRKVRPPVQPFGDLMADIHLTEAGPKGVSLKTLSVRRWLAHCDLRTSGDIGSITVGGADDSVIFAGVDDSVVHLPADEAGFVAVRSLGALTVKGFKEAQDTLLSGTNIAAWNLGKITLANVDADVESALAGYRLGSYARYDGKAVQAKAAKLTGPTDDDYAIDGGLFIRLVGPGGQQAPEINIEGNGASIVDGELTVDPGNLTDFGAADVAGGTVTQTFVIANTGSANLDLTGQPLVGISGRQAGDFAVVANPAASIAGGGQTSFQVRFDPAAPGARKALITIASNDANENPYTFTIQGYGQAAGTPEIDVRGAADTPIVDGDTAPGVEDGTDFGSIAAAGQTVKQLFVIRNTGLAALNLTGAPKVRLSGANAGDFAVTAQPDSPIPPGGEATFEITFDPSASGVRGATVTILNNDSNESPYTFAIRGTGTEYTVINVFDDFYGYWQQCQGLDDAQRLAQWDVLLEQEHPTFFADALYRGKTGADLAQYKATMIAAFWSDVAPRMDTLAQINAGIGQDIADATSEFQRLFPDYNAQRTVYVTISLSFRGKAVTVGGTVVLALGLEYFEPNTPQIRITIAHELFHLYHQQFFANGLGLYRTLWGEGLATYASSLVAPGYRDSVYLGFNSQKMTTCDDLLSQMAAELRQNLGSTDEVLKRKYFGAEPNGTEIPPEAGYYVGYRIAGRVGATRSLESLAKLQPVDVLALLTTELQALENA